MNHRLGWLCAMVVGALVSGCANDQGTLDEPEVFTQAEGPTQTQYCLDANDPAVHYESDDPVQCRDVSLRCAEGQYGFDNACGCGCIDKGQLSCPMAVNETHIRWVDRRPESCGADLPTCELGEVPFSNSCGCGCIQH